MTEFGQHAEWLSLIDISGPFLAEPVLREAFPQGLDGIDADKKKIVRQAYDEWREARDLNDPLIQELHRAWIELVLKQVLELDEDGKGDNLTSTVNGNYSVHVFEHDTELRPHFVLKGADPAAAPQMLICFYDPETSLGQAIKGDTWSATPAERMAQLCRGTGIRLGLITNGEQWMFVDVPANGPTSFASWYAAIWLQEPVTLQAFVSLFGIRRFFLDADQQLPALLDRSLTFQDDVTDALGEQVTRAVEVLVQAFDRADIDRNRQLLDGIASSELYEAGLTVMMRIVFILSAEERELLLLGDEVYEANYAVSTLRMQLRSETEEILERRSDAWSRLLSVFRAIYAGIDHEAMRLPAFGGSLFDPDRFAFLEGRKKETTWKSTRAEPLPIDNRTVLYLLEAVQLFQGRSLSYRALDVEQIGYVYEGLLERTVVRAKEPILDLDATKGSDSPTVALSALDDAAATGRASVEALLKKHSGSSAGRIATDLSRPTTDAQSEKLLTACHNDKALRDRVVPYFHLLRTDRWGYPLIYPRNAFMVSSGGDRRETGTHYTPKALTEVIVQDTLEPLVYRGVSEGQARESWRLRSAAELLDLKICDPAMGSGAFLVQVCRWLGEKLTDAWAEAELGGKSVTVEGEVLDELGAAEPLPSDMDERIVVARRLIAERCIYGVDMNPIAVELAKLSIWLVTLAKGRPFGFLDHNLRSGDSLLGIANLDQLRYLEMRPGLGSSKKLFASEMDEVIARALEIRSELRRKPIRDIRDVDAMAAMDVEARTALHLPTRAADAFIGEVLSSGGGRIDTTSLSIEIGNAFAASTTSDELDRRATRGLAKDSPENKVRHPFHWPLEFPEVFEREKSGFDAIVGNPPFVGGQRISGTFGPAYQSYLVQHGTYDEQSSVDLVVYFFLRAFALLRASGCMGLLGRRSLAEGKNRETGLSQILKHGGQIFVANTNIEWPGKASVIVHQLSIAKGGWQSAVKLDGRCTEQIYEDLLGTKYSKAMTIPSNVGLAFQGVILGGEGFKVTEEFCADLIAQDRKYQEVLFPFIGGGEVNKDPNYRPSCWVINFWDWSEERINEYPELRDILQNEVRPERQRLNAKGEYVLRSPLPERWWQHREKQSALYFSVGRGNLFDKQRDPLHFPSSPLSRVIAISTGATKFPVFTFLNNNSVYSNKLCVVCSDRADIFAALNSDIHGIWAWSNKTSIGADLYSLVYAHGNILETFPFPGDMLYDGNDELDALGEEFFARRQAYMESRNLGLTKFYNKFHSGAEVDGELAAVRELQQRINGCMFRLYGWDDLDSTCRFEGVSYLPAGHNIRFTVAESVAAQVRKRLSDLNKERSALSPSEAAGRGAGPAIEALSGT